MCWHRLHARNGTVALQQRLGGQKEANGNEVQVSQQQPQVMHTCSSIQHFNMCWQALDAHATQIARRQHQTQSLRTEWA
jgi:hypothetical protein